MDFLEKASKELNKEKPAEKPAEEVVDDVAAKEKAEEVVDTVVEPAPEGTLDAQPKTLSAEEVTAFIEKDEKLLLNILSKRTGKELSSFDDLKEVEIQERVVEKKPELPESIQKLWDYTVTTGRDINDYISANKDWKTLPKEHVVMEYIQRVEGLEGDTAKRYFDVYYNLDVDEYSEREVEMAKLNLEKDYKKAVNYFEEQKKEFFTPSQQVDLRREAEDKERAERLQWAEGMTSAINSLDNIKVGEMDYSVSDKKDLVNRFQSIDGIISKYKTADGLNYRGLAETIYKGENIDAIIKVAQDDAIAKYIESEANELSPKADSPEAVPKTGLTQEKIAQEAAKIFGYNY
jgi:hypothetical protein